MKTELVWKDGWLCIAQTDNGYSTPERSTLYYPIMRVGPEEAEGCYGPIPKQVRSCGDGIYYDGVRRYALAENGKTKPMFHESVPVPCPKVRAGIQTRWVYSHGSSRWEKLLKTGWVSA